MARLLAFDRDGDVVYRNASYPAYFDVDPVTGTRATVEYVAAERYRGPDCPERPCSLNVVERLNLTTGATERVYAAVTPQWESGRWHDVDRVNDTHLAVADIAGDGVFVVDARTGEFAWRWNASDHFPRSAGGRAGDWTHLNDVEVLADGRIVAGIRNMDQVVFLEPGAGVVEGWTLGRDDDHDVLYEPHNPDYLPADRGGPALLVADSENNRVVEYRRTGDGWTRAWSWRDRRLQWPRDADRLPDGHTLVVDANGNRVVEVDAAGGVVWAVDVGRPYDAERLGAGGGSAGGWAAGSTVADGAPADAPPRVDQDAREGRLALAVRDALPSLLVNGILFVAPAWVGFVDLLWAGLLALDALAWGALEWRWSGRSLGGGWRALRGRLG